MTGRGYNSVIGSPPGSCHYNEVLLTFFFPYTSKSKDHTDVHSFCIVSVIVLFILFDLLKIFDSAETIHYV